MDLGDAIDKHAEWKSRFRTAITVNSQMDADVISRDDCCNLGQWLHGEGRASYGALDGYAACIKSHAYFHVQAGKIARAINDRNYAQAGAMLGPGTPYSVASSAVKLAITMLQRESGL